MSEPELYDLRDDDPADPPAPTAPLSFDEDADWLTGSSACALGDGGEDCEACQ